MGKLIVINKSGIKAKEEQNNFLLEKNNYWLKKLIVVFSATLIYASSIYASDVQIVQSANLKQIVMKQLQKLSVEEQRSLLNILQRTSLSNIVRTIEEINHRLEVIEWLRILLFKYEKDTGELDHLQKVLDENHWIFGEQFQLFGSTEGRLSTKLSEYANVFLQVKIIPSNIDARGEVDLFLTKTEEIKSVKKQRNMIVEIKRPSVLLSKKELDQILKYMRMIKNQDFCDSDNQSWEFLLVGNTYSYYIREKIRKLRSLGEEEKWLVFMDENYRFKVYVRNWEEILLEQEEEMKYLRDRLQLQSKQENIGWPDQIVEDLLKNKKE